MNNHLRLLLSDIQYFNIVRYADPDHIHVILLNKIQMQVCEIEI